MSTWHSDEHPRGHDGRFIEKPTPPIDTSLTASVLAATTNDTHNEESIYRWGVPDWIAPPPHDLAHIVVANPTPRETYIAAGERSGEWAEVTYTVPGLKEPQAARGRLSRDDHNNIVIYGEPNVDGRYVVGVNEHIRIPAQNVLAIHADTPTLAVGELDDHSDMHHTGNPDLPGALYEPDLQVLHLRRVEGTVLSYRGVPHNHGPLLIDNPASVHGRYPLETVFAPDRTRIPVGAGGTVRYRLSDRTLTLHDGANVITAGDVPPAEYATALGSRSPAVALRRVVERHQATVTEG